MMTDQELHEMDWANVKALDPEKVAKAVAMLQDQLFEEVKTDLRQRMTENRHGWLYGRADAPCWLCKGKGEVQYLKMGVLDPSDFEDRHAKYKDAIKDPANVEAPVQCPHCLGRGTAPELGMHFGFGMAVRNLLRKEGFGEDYFGIENLDDVYVPLLEMAVGFDAP